MISAKEQVARQLDTLSEVRIREVANFIAFLKFQERMDQTSVDSAEPVRADEQVSSPDNPSLEEMLAGITPENMHGEVDWGAPVGKEVW
ncbi:MAG TPA: hypothetical protein VGB07_10480 [Blastocatellia bacterium]